MVQLARALYGVGRYGRGLCTGTEAQDSMVFQKRKLGRPQGERLAYIG